MSQQPAPAAATWLLDQFCSSPEHESVVGDLFEQYHLGRDRFWFWRQALVILFLGLYGRAARRPLVQKSRPAARRGGFGSLLVPVAGVALLIFAGVFEPDVAAVIVFFSVWGVFGLGIVLFWKSRNVRMIHALELQPRWAPPRAARPGPSKKHTYLKLSDL